MEKNEKNAETIQEVKKEEVVDVKPKKKKLKKILIYTSLTVILLLFILSMSLGFIIKASVNNFLPPLTGTDVSMESCSLNPFTGSVRIKKFIIGNPEGYQSKHAFKLNEVFVDIDMGSLSSDKIIIQTILVDGMEVSLETKMTETNIGVIKGNIDKATKGDTTEESEKEPLPDNQAKGKSKKIEIDDFQFINSHVTLAAQIMDSGAGGTIPIPDIKMTGIGAGSSGATVSEVSADVINELYAAIIKAAKGFTANTFKDGAGKSVEKLKEGAGAMIKGVKNLFGNDEK